MIEQIKTKLQAKEKALTVVIQQRRALNELLLIMNDCESDHFWITRNQLISWEESLRSEILELKLLLDQQNI